MSDTVILALIVSVGTIIATLVPVIMKVIDARERRHDREEDMRRQDEVADAANKAAQGVADAVVISSNAAIDDRTTMKGQLKQIHSLVNSNLMAQMVLTLAATKATLAVLRRLELNDEVRAEILSIEKDIVGQERVLAERNAATSLTADPAKETKMGMGLIGILLTFCIIALFVWGFLAILAHMGIVIPQIVKIIVGVIVGILILVFIAQLLGAPIGFGRIG